MLPILRIIPVGGVFLAIMILVLSLSPPGGSRPGMPRALLAARGPLIEKDEHPEWRQMLILAAVRRADEVSRLRELPDTTFVIEIPQDTNKDTNKDADTKKDAGKDAEKDADKIAGLPIDRNDADPEDVTGSINEMPGTTIPIDIGETSSTELPMKTPEESPPVITTPERAKPPRESRRKNRYHASRTAAVVAAPNTKVPPPFNLLELIFGGFQAKTPAGTVPGRQSAAASPTPQ